ncbi:hypothetical protein ABB37_01357 [Leptomonas pyrrhocoris]|uniref:Transmembrane protein n=1 Tax=Leptomonas pyrrhocoris TaxID=157538 RepID=A0A0N0DZ55_LEPPY|nr:hypothetical protein ABB37_01357 [Leptomonas pyrrhocoris]KPA84905.1 hypothetical protein ABB37_01357 [Leptomonas pyrrhocoris]|eukprot:XP_015663344.1 hypothetical protein ABB37_01357 [Leptomonas pyrrhocoris]
MHSSNKPGCSEHGELVSSTPRCGEHNSASSTSLDADDEADAGQPADTAELASTPPSALVNSSGHRWLMEPHVGESPLRRLRSAHEAEAEDTRDTSTPGPHVPLPHSSSAEQPQANGSLAPSASSAAAPPRSPVLRSRRSLKCAGRSNSRRTHMEASSSDATLPSSLLASLAARVSLSQPPSAFALSVVDAEATQSGCVAAEDSITSSLLRAARGASTEGEAGMHVSSSPPVSPPFPTTTAAAAAASDFSDGSPGPRNSDVSCSPLRTHLRLTPRINAELQQFGCCVFFFPAPLISWLFPLVGHVAISNAEGSRLFTFESSYYVREEKLVTVLDRVLREEMTHDNSVLSSPARRNRPGQRSDTSDRANSPSPAQSPLLCRGSAMNDASASDAGRNSPSDTSAVLPPPRSASMPVFPPRPTARPPRRTRRSRPAGGGSATGHTHTRCVRIWDLKPLLMESRGRRTRRAPYIITGEGGKQAAVALWERLQGLLQPTEGSAGSGPSTRSAPSSLPASHIRGRDKAELSDNAEGSPSAPGVSSSSSADEENEFELLDAETAHFYNRNLNVTIRLFRGSADGSNNSPDVVLQHHSSFSFVGFVLEACGIGSQAKLSAATPVPAAAPVGGGGDGKSNVDEHAQGKRNDASGTPNVSNETTAASATAVSAAESTEANDETHWGAVKLLFHVCVFGKWHRGEGRLRRALHGGSITSAAILWAIILVAFFHYLSPMFSW